ncbi:hypothetical protein QFC22_005141 [Naganishia vaughanmartiniae]|uniref:Uncharacterized protein n=1 Tax=Naganishia vaughanmartiniae TaxID=1424756 RepID=A0ACC2WVC2_9TREE|nr:hypothetical protein QFC22_005141 [Naganishia vaughanmartiniae]
MFSDSLGSDTRRSDGPMERSLREWSALGHGNGQSGVHGASQAGPSHEPWSTTTGILGHGGDIGGERTNPTPNAINQSMNPNAYPPSASSTRIEQHGQVVGNMNNVAHGGNEEVPKLQFMDDLVWGLSDHPDHHDRLLAQADQLMAMNAKSPSGDGLELLGWLTEPGGAVNPAAAAPLPLPRQDLNVASALLPHSSSQRSQPLAQPPCIWPQTSSIREPTDEDGDIPLPWNYTYSYAKINRYISKQVTRVVSILRPYYLSIVHDRTDIELDAQTRTLRSLTRRIEDATTAFSPCPTLIWRRTGEIVGANKLMADLLGISKAKLTSVRRGETEPAFDSTLRDFSSIRLSCKMNRLRP